MSNPSRKMCTLRKVTAVTPIEGADRIECVHIGGWTCVDQKGLWHPGDICTYFEIDSFLPTSDERYAFLAQFGEKTMTIDNVKVSGHVLRTRRMRGQYSQGLCLKPSEFGISDEEAAKLCDEETDISERIGVWEYQRPVKEDGSPKFILNPYDRSVAPVTDAERIQNCTKFWDVLQKVDCYCTVKVDGSSMTMVYDSRQNKLRLFSHHREIDYNEPSIAQVCYEQAKSQGLVGFCETHPDTTIQFELTGPKLQHGATKEPKCHVFAIWDRNDMRKVPLAEVVARRCSDIGWEPIIQSHVPILFSRLSDFDTVDDALAWADTITGNIQDGKKDEGAVFHITGQGTATDDEWMTLQHRLGANMEVKAVSNLYLMRRK